MIPYFLSSLVSTSCAPCPTNFGKDKASLLLTHKCFIRSLFNYAAPVVYPSYSATSIKKLQRVQNKSLRLATGCHAASSIDHLHAEAMELPVKEHLHLLSAQFLAQSLQPHHVSHPNTTLDQGPRKLKDTLCSKVLADVSPYLEDDGTLQRGNYAAVKNQLHPDIVSKNIRNSNNNRVIGLPPPPVNSNENHLPRIIRVTLAQLRSGFCAISNFVSIKPLTTSAPAEHQHGFRQQRSTTSALL